MYVAKNQISSRYDVVVYKDDYLANLFDTVYEAADWIGCGRKYLYTVLRGNHKIMGYEVYYVEKDEQ